MLAGSRSCLAGARLRVTATGMDTRLAQLRQLVQDAQERKPALARAYQVAARDGRPAVINCQGKKEFWDRAKYPPGAIGKVEPGTMSYYH